MIPKSLVTAITRRWAGTDLARARGAGVPTGASRRGWMLSGRAGEPGSFDWRRP